MTKPLAPELTEAQARRFTRQSVLRLSGRISEPHIDAWNPDMSAKATKKLYVDPKIEAKSPYQFQSLQAAINYTHSQVDDHIEIVLSAGEHDGPCYIPAGPRTISIVGAGEGKTEIIANIDANMTGDEYARQFVKNIADSPLGVREILDAITSLDRIGTFNSSVLRIESKDTKISHLTIRNTYNCDSEKAGSTGLKNAEGQFKNGQHQAVALMSEADRLLVKDVSLCSFQDTVYLNSPTGQISRSVFLNCSIEGDVDFIFGQGTTYFHNCRIHSIGTRSRQSWVAAPSTNIRTPFGFVFNECEFTHDGIENAKGGRILMGRQWFEAARASPYSSQFTTTEIQLGEVSNLSSPTGTISRASLESVGKCVVLGSRFSDGYNPATIWGGWSCGHHNREGNWINVPDDPRYRPVQTNPADFKNHLKEWLVKESLDYTDLDDTEPWLGNFNCVVSTSNL